MREIKKVAVLGAGVMGQGIAAHIAGAGIPVMLLDIVPPKLNEEDEKAGLTQTSPQFRNKFALKGIDSIKNSRPSVIYSKRDLKLITPGNFEDDWDKLKECDWIVEVVIERLDIKKSVYEKIEKIRQADCIVSSNTSGLPLTSLSEGRSDDFLKNFLVTHFFNPVRYMKLVEIISSDKTDPKIVEEMAEILEERLGKGVVYAKDTPNFIANRIGTYSSMVALKHLQEGNYTIEEADKILGPATGKPKSAMFRTVDLVGVDLLPHVTKTIYDNCPHDEQREVFVLPDIINKMIEKGYLGNKTRQGFYKKTTDEKGNKQILALDLKTCEYRPKEEVKFDSLKAAKGVENVGERIKAVIAGGDRASDLAWKTTRDTLIYAGNRIPEIADDIVNIDNAMKWGYNWEAGPFEIIDGMGVQETVEKIENEGLKVPTIFKQVLEKGEGSFYKKVNGQLSYFDIETNEYKPVPRRPGIIFLKDIKETQEVLAKNAGASLIDIGDGVICLEFHTKMNAIDSDIGEMGMQGLELLKSDKYQGMVINNEAENFSVGANLMLIWLEAQQKNWDKIENLVKQFQDFGQAMRLAPKPVVAAPFGLALGGGCEIAMAADAVRAAAETYIGLVEVGVGLIPAGGGCKNMLLNCEASLRAKGQRVWMAPGDGGPFPKVQRAFERIAFAKVATSAKEAIEFDYLKRSDKISLDKESLLRDAKRDVLEMAKDYQPAQLREDILVPGLGGEMAVKSSIRGFLALGQVSEHDALIAEKLAHILCGGDVPTQAYVSEQHILDLEREVFLQLLGTEKTQARMQYMLMNNKPLRN
ncbi:MAG: enoyl-CoA hydratase/isomerase family protein [Deltaproteobacteria bacterium]|nr:enoyl-CoA hydratase/isomerase family protein [Deltaproteobacteria bacterium]